MPHHQGKRRYTQQGDTAEDRDGQGDPMTCRICGQPGSRGHAWGEKQRNSSEQERVLPHPVEENRGDESVQQPAERPTAGHDEVETGEMFDLRPICGQSRVCSVGHHSEHAHEQRNDDPNRSGGPQG